jgi:hypothetical protein
MNVRFISYVRLLLRLCCVLGMVAQAQAGAVASCFTGWKQASQDCWIFVINLDDFGGSCLWARGWVSATDPVRGVPSGSFVWPSGSLGNGHPSGGGCVAFNVLGQSLQQLSDGSFSSSMCRPQGAAGTSQQGYFLEYFDVWTTDQSKAQRYLIPWWIINGTCTNQPPSPPADPYTPPGAVSGTQTGPSSVTLSVTNSKGTPIPYLSAYLYGPTGATKTLDANGSTAFSGCAVGNYTMHIYGTYKNLSGSSVSVDYSQAFALAASEVRNLSMTINESGFVTSSTQSTSAAGGGSDSQPNWLSSAVSSLFVPDQQHIDNVKGKMAGIYTWGPFALISDLVALSNTPPTSKGLLSIPVPEIDPCGCKYTSSSTNNVPVNYDTITQQGGWSTIRGWLGAGVWLGFVSMLAWRFMPRQQM